MIAHQLIANVRVCCFVDDLYRPVACFRKLYPKFDIFKKNITEKYESKDQNKVYSHFFLFSWLSDQLKYFCSIEQTWIIFEEDSFITVKKDFASHWWQKTGIQRSTEHMQQLFALQTCAFNFHQAIAIGDVNR